MLGHLRLTAVLFLSCLAACTQVSETKPNISNIPAHIATASELSCLASFEVHEDLLSSDAAFSQAIAGQPALRMTRTLAHWNFAALAPTEQVVWLVWSHRLALETAQTLGLAVEACNDSVWRLAIQSPAFIADLTNPVVQDEYRDWLRFVGLYPITRLPFVSGVKRELNHQAQLQQSYKERQLSAPNWLFYQAHSIVEASEVLPVAPLRAPSSTDTIGLLNRWAPSFAIEQGAAGANRVGRIGRSAKGVLEFDSHAISALYSYVTWGEFEQQPVLQLNYQIWFSARPATSAWDPLAGVLDGIHWRVHLNTSGELIAFDTMHTCGCWYQLYPAPSYLVRSANDYWQEPIFVASAPATNSAGLVLISADRHSVVGLREAVVLQDPLQLTVVQVSGAGGGFAGPLTESALAYRRSFNDRGIIAESKRSERYFFWPMGIPKAGSMRAPGHHAIAFTGRLHFDDPLLLQRLGLHRRR